MAFRLPRLTWVFYAFYPSHLLVLLGIRLEWFNDVCDKPPRHVAKDARQK